MALSPRLIKPITGTADIALFDVASQRSSVKTVTKQRPFPKDYGIAVVEGYRKIMIAGGVMPGTYVMLNTCEVIDVESGEVKEVASLPLVLKAMRLVNCNGDIYCLGGCTEGQEHISPQALCLLYNQRYDAWVRLSDLPQAVLFPGAMALAGEIWLTGGFLSTQAGATVLDLIQVYNVTRNQWRVLEQSLLRPSYFHACVSLPTGDTLICCGLRDSFSNRFSYILGSEERSTLPEKLSMCLLDPPVIHSDFIYFLSEESNLLIYDWRSRIWTCFESTNNLA